MSTHENSIIRHRASPRPIGMALESPSSVSSFSLEEKKKKEEKRKLVFREWKEATTVRFFDQDLFDPRTSEADSCLWYPSNDDFVKNSKRRTRRFCRKSNTELLYDRARTSRR